MKRHARCVVCGVGCCAFAALLSQGADAGAAAAPDPERIRVAQRAPDAVVPTARSLRRSAPPAGTQSGSDAGEAGIDVARSRHPNREAVTPVPGDEERETTLRRRDDASRNRRAAARIPSAGSGNPGITGPSGHVTDGQVHGFQVEDVKLRHALDALLRPLGLDYSVENGYLWVTTPDRIRHTPTEPLETRIYELRNQAASKTLPKVIIRQPAAGVGQERVLGAGDTAAGTGRF